MKSDSGRQTGEVFSRRRSSAQALAATAALALCFGAAATTPASAITVSATQPGSAVDSDAPQLPGGSTAPSAATDSAAAPAATDETQAPADADTPDAPADSGTAAASDTDVAAADENAPAATPLPAGVAEATHTIAEVQGATDVSPMVGQTVTVHGVITADHRTGGYGGIVVQTEGSGGAAAGERIASDGIFVYLSGKDVPGEIGSSVAVTGAVSEYFGQTQLTPAASHDVALIAQEAVLPAPTPLPVTVVGDAREAYENMLVAPAGDYFVTSSHQLYNFGTLWLSPGGMPVKATETERPGAAADAIAAANRSSRILLDDGYSIQVSNNLHPADQPYFTADTVVRNGDTVDFTGQSYVLQYGFGDWRLQPVLPLDSDSEDSLKATFNAKNERPGAPVVTGDASVAAFNVYNYFTTLKSDNAEARGATTAAQFATQRSKIVAALTELDADIVGLMEVENSVKFGQPADTALADLVDGLNVAAGGDIWDFVPTPKSLRNPSTTDFISNAIIYKKHEVTPKGDPATIDDETVWHNAREPIAQAFDIDGRTVTVVANHFKSKSGTGAEPADGQGHFNADRVRQAASLLEFTTELETAAGSPDILLVGDFNAYGEEDPIVEFTSAGWIDTVPALAPGQYSYSFNGELGSLDHVLASPSLADSVSDAAIWAANSAEWGDRGYGYAAAEAGTPFRASDHDPIIVGLATTQQPVSIDIATINDFHGRIEADGKAAGAAVIAGAVAEFERDNPNFIFAGAGDLIGASTFTSFIQDDEPTIDALNLAGLDVSAAGNHEFDEGWKDLRDRVQDRADWEYISANVFVTETGQPALAPSWVTEVDGVNVGFVGAVTEDLDTLVSPEGIKDLEVRSIAESVNAAAAALRDGDEQNGEADVIILLVHEGAATADAASITPESQLGKIVNGVGDDVDAIVSAHTHLAYNHVIDGRPVVSAGQYGENLGLMNLQVDRDTKELISITNEIKPLVVDGTPQYAADPAVQAIVDAAKAEADVLGGITVGTITADFNRARQSDGKTENRGGESTIGNFVADVHLWSTGADIALMNPGGIRANLTFASSGDGDPDGNVTYREAATVQPFANSLMTKRLTGAQVQQLLEEQWQPEGSARPFLKLGVSAGLQYQYDPAAERGAHITAVTLDGEPLDPQATYTVAANAFLAGGGDNFVTFREGTDAKDTGRADLQSMVEWFAINKEATPDLGKRGVGVSTTAAQQATDRSGAGQQRVAAAATGEALAAGDEVTVELQSLAFSGGETPPEFVTARLAGADVAEAPVDAAVTDAWDDAGKATLTFTVPEGIAGEQTLEVVTSDGHTRFEVPLALASVGGPGDGGPGDGGPGDGGPGDGGPGTGWPGTGSGDQGSGGQHNGGAASGTNGSAGTLSTTGADVGWIAGVTATLLLLGAALITVARRRSVS